MNARIENVASSVGLLEVNIEADIKQLIAQSALQTTLADVPHAAEIIHQIPVYDGARVRDIAQRGESDADVVSSLQREWVEVLLDGAGVIVIRNAIDDLQMLDDVTAAIQQ